MWVTSCCSRLQLPRGDRNRRVGVTRLHALSSHREQVLLTDNRGRGGEVSRRLGLAIGGLMASQALFSEAHAQSQLDLSITDKVYFDIGVCQKSTPQDRGLGDPVFCTDPAPIGRLVIVESGAYTGTLFHKVYPGQYIMAGQQGSKRMGKAFILEHSRPGVVSLSIGENDEVPILRDRLDYRNMEFLITTGPGPAPQLDGQDIVFGKVEEGFDTIVAVTEVPTFTPSDKLKAFNTFAEKFGDQRAAKARESWGKPLKPVVIIDSGVLTGTA